MWLCFRFPDKVKKTWYCSKPGPGTVDETAIPQQAPEYAVCISKSSKLIEPFKGPNLKKGHF